MMEQLEALRETVRCATDRNMPEDIGSELGLHHLRIMLETASKGGFSESKLGRWLGWAQCAVVAAGIGLTLEDMKDLNMRYAGQ